MHTPVYLEEVLEALQVEPDKKFIDCTAGEGGHLKKIAEKGAEILAMDYDIDQISRLMKQLPEGNITFAHANFKDIKKVATANKFPEVDGILMDLGLSMRQLTEKGIGLSFQKPEESLDMRIYQEDITAADILNGYSKDEIVEMLMKNAEETTSHAIATEIVSYRLHKPFKRVQDLLTVLKNLNSSSQTKARVFQALRIEVNQEKQNLQQALTDAVELLKENGRLVIITFHSLEDRLVKQFGKANAQLKEVKVRIRKNQRARFERSAQLRVYTKVLA